MKPDRLSTVTALICAAGLLVVSWLGLALDAVSIKRSPAAIAESPRGCPAPAAGEQLHIIVAHRDGLLDVTCRTVHAALPMKRSQR